ncbi:MAG: thiamine phosphate synthase [Planctomycetaceae bacterium]|nr:thiamine phosphate synthase [Planctomycetaceae bacterium]
MMRYQFTPAVERALQIAANWTLRADGEAELDAPQLLLALASEVECRAAVVLQALAIDPAAIVERWPQLRALETPPPVAPATLFTAAVGESLAQVISRLSDHPRPLSLATEHVLLGLALAEHDVARWLGERRLDIAALEAEIHRRGGQQFIDQPLEMPLESPPLPVQVPRDAATQSTESEQLAVYRLLDAAANRAREGLRVIEDYVRFALDDALLTREWKQLRHDLTAVLGQFAMPERLAARDTLADVGTRISTASEQSRPDIAAVVAANMARLQESLRSLEEYAKTVAPSAAATLEQLRYRSYTLQRSLDVTQRRSREWDTCQLYVLLDGCESLAAFTTLAQQLIAAGVDVLQLRDKRLADRELLERGRRLRELTRDSATRFIMNDRADLAVLADADGVHVGQEELTVKDARTIVGPRRLVGVSTHSLEQARQAVLDGADYIGVGPTFPSQTKNFEQFPGVELLRAVAAEIRLPAFAIGGITLPRLDEVLATGIRRVAVSGAIVAAVDPVVAVNEFRARLSQSQ